MELWIISKGLLRSSELLVTKVLGESKDAVSVVASDASAAPINTKDPFDLLRLIPTPMGFRLPASSFYVRTLSKGDDIWRIPLNDLPNEKKVIRIAKDEKAMKAAKFLAGPEFIEDLKRLGRETSRYISIKLWKLVEFLRERKERVVIRGKFDGDDYEIKSDAKEIRMFLLNKASGPKRVYPRLVHVWLVDEKVERLPESGSDCELEILEKFASVNDLMTVPFFPVNHSTVKLENTDLLSIIREVLKSVPCRFGAKGGCLVIIESKDAEGMPDLLPHIEGILDRAGINDAELEDFTFNLGSVKINVMKVDDVLIGEAIKA